MYRTITGNEFYILEESSKSSSKIQCCHRHPYHSLSDTAFILHTVLQNHNSAITSTHYFRPSGLLMKGAKNVVSPQRGSLKPEEAWASETICVGYVEAPGAFPLAGSDLLLHGTWLDCLRLQGRNTLPVMSTQTSNLPEDQLVNDDCQLEVLSSLAYMTRAGPLGPLQESSCGKCSAFLTSG